ncbi:DUF6332 family protein [Streptomyces sp. NPDC059785]|uniref:DUF6332 family protein n=1 Tax=unclassified Streptomyces TaxID=2593676 RepID=UPI0036676F2E
MDAGRESRVEKDAMTVEIGFALVTAVLLAAAVLGVALIPALLLGVHEPAGRTVLTAGGLVGAVAGFWRLVLVLVRFDRNRRLGR